MIRFQITIRIPDEFPEADASTLSDKLVDAVLEVFPGAGVCLTGGPVPETED